MFSFQWLFIQITLDWRFGSGKVMSFTSIRWRYLHRELHQHHRSRLQNQNYRTRWKNNQTSDLGCKLIFCKQKIYRFSTSYLSMISKFHHINYSGETFFLFLFVNFFLFTAHEKKQTFFVWVFALLNSIHSDFWYLLSIFRLLVKSDSEPLLPATTVVLMVSLSFMTVRIKNRSTTWNNGSKKSNAMRARVWINYL